MKKDDMTAIVMEEVELLRKLTPYERDLYSQYKTCGAEALMKDPEKFEELLKFIEANT